MTYANALRNSLFVSAVLLSACTAHPTAINQAGLRSHVQFLADDLLEGRGVGARGGAIAAQYIATRLQAMGCAAPHPTGASSKRWPWWASRPTR